MSGKQQKSKAAEPVRRKAASTGAAVMREEAAAPRGDAASIPLWMRLTAGALILAAAVLIVSLARPSAPNANLASVGTLPTGVPTLDTSITQRSLMLSVAPMVRHYKGDPNAPVTMVEFSDFQCPYCGQFFLNTEPKIIEQYVQNGKVRFGYFNYIIYGPASIQAAEAAECAADQGKFWEYHDALFKSQTSENWGGFGADNLKKFAKELNLDTQAFNDCLDSGKYTSLVKTDSSFASSLGVMNTPSFFINGERKIGALPFEAFQQTFEALLK